MQTEAQSTSTPILKKTRVNTPDTLEEETDKETMVSFNQAHLILKVSYKFFPKENLLPIKQRMEFWEFL